DNISERRAADIRARAQAQTTWTWLGYGKDSPAGQCPEPRIPSKTTRHVALKVHVPVLYDRDDRHPEPALGSRRRGRGCGGWRCRGRWSDDKGWITPRVLVLDSRRKGVRILQRPPQQ